ncbi:MAG TPA: peptide chain release factor N(5)-glutamine methyltransferase [Candidatus Saccharimonadales bacterium]|nr:peptide chain release factor N(5)-glutamine methyltransferase [Candidatus Saccharimonadales bacterium]
MATVEALLRDGVSRLRESGSETPRLDAELLLGQAVGLDRTAIVAHPEAPVGEGAARRFATDLGRRATGEPVAYIRGFKEFYGLALVADARALIPRPETELIVELGLAEVLHRLTRAARPAGTPPLRVADVGTGSGTIAVSMAVALRRCGAARDVDLFATDISPEALQLARENAVGHGVADRMRFAEADLLPPVLQAPFDVLLANLPYVASNAIAGLPVAASFEPRLALDGGPDGLAVIERLLGRLTEAIRPDGTALLEIGSDQDDAMVALVERVLPDWSCRIEPDLASHPRVARIEPPVGRARPSFDARVGRPAGGGR